MRTFCITLLETPDREAGARKHFSDMGVSAEFAYGIHAGKFGLTTLHPYEVDHPGSGYIMPVKHVGLFLSHYMLWSAFMLMPDECFMVIEDDCEFPIGWSNRLSESLKNCPTNADMLFVGSCNCADKSKTKIAGDIWDVRYPQCTHAYIVWKKALPLLIESQRDCWAPIDLALIFRSFPKLNVYTVLPRIVSQIGMNLSN